MLNKIRLPLVLSFSVTTLANKHINNYLPITIDGVVLDVVSHKPISSLHVFTKRGEEEAFTNDQGSFHFSSWEPLPLVITIQEPGGNEKHVKVTVIPTKLKIFFP